VYGSSSHRLRRHDTLDGTLPAPSSGKDARTEAGEFDPWPRSTPSADFCFLFAPSNRSNACAIAASPSHPSTRRASSSFRCVSVDSDTPASRLSVRRVFMVVRYTEFGVELSKGATLQIALALPNRSYFRLVKNGVTVDTGGLLPITHARSGGSGSENCRRRQHLPTRRATFQCATYHQQGVSATRMNSRATC